MEQKILITGITGFVGSHMADYALGKNAKVYGLKRWNLSRLRNVRHILSRVEFSDCDLTDPIAIQNIIKKIKPDKIFHFAAESFISPSWVHPSHYMDVNYKGTVNLLEAIRIHSPQTKILLAGSSEEFGEVAKEDLPIVAKTFLQPVSPYAVSKVAQDLIGYVYFKSYGLNVIRTKAFNFEGPRRDYIFGIPWYAYQAVRIEQGLQEPIIRTGFRGDRRTFMHVKDLAEAYWLAIDKCIPGKSYIVGADEKEYIFTFDQVLDMLIKRSIYKGKIEKVIDKQFVRPTSVPRLICDSSEFRAITKWKPKIPFNVIIDEYLSYWRDFIKKDLY